MYLLLYDLNKYKGTFWMMHLKIELQWLLWNHINLEFIELYKYSFYGM